MDHPLATRPGLRLDTDGQADFSIWADGAEEAWLALFDDQGLETRHRLDEVSPGVFATRVAGVRAGQRYGVRTAGAWDPRDGRRNNPAKLLLDPYALAVDGPLVPHPSVVGTGRARHPDPVDSAPYVPRSVVVAGTHLEQFDWSGDRPPRTPWERTVVYEAHVKGLTRQHPRVPEPLRGTYAGAAHPAVLEYLVDLGVTALELLPVAHFVSEPGLVRRGLVNYWGYNPVAFFAPHAGYAVPAPPGGQVAQFKAMVAAMHAAGLEVILDVVVNHTAEQDGSGPLLSWRGLDDLGYYRHLDDGRYDNPTGCGNALDLRQAHVVRLVTDALRYWVTQMHVDGFRFDLATTLARAGHGFDPRHPFLVALAQDPVLSAVKLIAEPWDLGPGGYQLGGFPRGWSEWNDRYRDAVRTFWLAAPGRVRELATRIAGSSDIFGPTRRTPTASVNFVTAHDGFTLADLVTYARKRNEANGESNLDGTDTNLGWDAGVDGPSTEPQVVEVRQRLQRDLLATLALSTGVPMLRGGDEFATTALGNNNAYCQDNAVSWLDWSWLDTAGPRHDLHAWVRRLFELRAHHPVLRRGRFFDGLADDQGRGDIAWFTATGAPMGAEQWADDTQVTLGVYLEGHRVADDSFLLWLHAGRTPTAVVHPGLPWARSYRVVLDTARALPEDAVLEPGTSCTRPAASLLLLHAEAGPGDPGRAEREAAGAAQAVATSPSSTGLAASRWTGSTRTV
ncbi:MAG: glycogen debranching protein GlgX [Actinomycetes bacterium]